MRHNKVVGPEYALSDRDNRLFDLVSSLYSEVKTARLNALNRVDEGGNGQRADREPLGGVQAGTRRPPTAPAPHGNPPPHLPANDGHKIVSSHVSEKFREVTTLRIEGVGSRVINLIRDERRGIYVSWCAGIASSTNDIIEEIVMLLAGLEFLENGGVDAE